MPYPDPPYAGPVFQPPDFTLDPHLTGAAERLAELARLADTAPPEAPLLAARRAPVGASAGTSFAFHALDRTGTRSLCKAEVIGVTGGPLLLSDPESGADLRVPAAEVVPPRQQCRRVPCARAFAKALARAAPLAS